MRKTRSMAKRQNVTPSKKRKLNNEEIAELVNNSQMDSMNEVPMFATTELMDSELKTVLENSECVESNPDQDQEPENTVLHADLLVIEPMQGTAMPTLPIAELEVTLPSPSLDLAENVKVVASHNLEPASLTSGNDENTVDLSSDEEEKETPGRQKQKSFGRPKTNIWENYIVTVENKKKKANCKTCGTAVSAKADRLRKHSDDCAFKLLVRKRNADYFKTSVSAPVLTVSVPDPSANDTQAQGRQSTITDHFDFMTAEEKGKVDKKVAEFIYENNLPFSISETKSFISLLQALRPAYTPPSRTDIGGKFLDEIHSEKKQDMKKYLAGKKVTIMQDGWSTVQNDPVLVHAISDGRKTVFLNAIATEDNIKNSEYCFEVLHQAVKTAEEDYDVSVVGCVTDNCNTMKKLHRIVQENFPEFLVYGCNTHLLNLIGQDLTDQNVMDSIIEVQKFFRNHHYESAKLKLLGGHRPKLPGNTRWNSQIGTCENYIKNHALYLGIARDEKSQLYKKDSEINKSLLDGNLYTSVVDMTGKLAPVAKLLDDLQKETARYTDAVHGWFELKQKLPYDAEKRGFKKRFKMAISDVGLVAYMLHPYYKGELLYGRYLERGREWLAKKNPYYVTIVSNLQAGDTGYFPASMMSKEVVKDMDPINWWKVVAKSSSFIPNGFVDLAESLLMMPASTSGLERSLSTMGQIITQERNRLGVDKASKLCFVNFHSK